MPPNMRLKLSVRALDIRVHPLLGAARGPQLKRDSLGGIWALSYTRNVKVRELIRVLEDDGWMLARTRGSHRQFHHPTKPGTVTVAGKPGVDVPVGTLRSALKQAGLLGRKE